MIIIIIMQIRIIIILINIKIIIIRKNHLPTKYQKVKDNRRGGGGVG